MNQGNAGTQDSLRKMNGEFQNSTPVFEGDSLNKKQSGQQNIKIDSDTSVNRRIQKSKEDRMYKLPPAPDTTTGPKFNKK